MNRSSLATEVVTRCVARTDGGWMVVTNKGRSGSSPVEIPVGAHVNIIQGQAVRANG